MGKDLNLTAIFHHEESFFRPPLETIVIWIANLYYNNHDQLVEYLENVEGHYKQECFDEYLIYNFGYEWMNKLTNNDFLYPEPIPYDEGIIIHDGRFFNMFDNRDTFESIMMELGIPSEYFEINLTGIEFNCSIGIGDDCKRSNINKMLIGFKTNFFLPPTFVGSVKFDMLID